MLLIFVITAFSYSSCRAIRITVIRGRSAADVQQSGQCLVTYHYLPPHNRPEATGNDYRSTEQEQLNTITATSSTLTEGMQVCPNDWMHFEDSCYAFIDDIAPWSTAMEMCRELNSSLLVITNDRENNFIAEQLRARHEGSGGYNFYWLRINDFVHEGHWVRGDNQPLAYLPWAVGQPDNGMLNENGQDCAVITGDGTWHDMWCEDYTRGSDKPRPVCKKGVQPQNDVYPSGQEA